MSDKNDPDSDEDYPEIGNIRNGEVLVCMGDDRPDQWEDWLESLVTEFERLEGIAKECSLDLNAGRKYGILDGWQEFCEVIGVNVGAEFWEGEMNSGQWVMGWIRSRAIPRAERNGEEILDRLREHLNKHIRLSIAKELESIDDLEELIERTRNDRGALIVQGDKLNDELMAERKTVAMQVKVLEQMTREDTSALSLDCLRLACAVANGDQTKLLAGPLVLWSDRVVYALTKRGGVPLPEGSAPLLLLQELERGGHPVVRVEEMTAIAFSTSGKIHRRGEAHISGWTNVWKDVEKIDRNFIVNDPEQLKVVREIHEYYKMSAPSIPGTSSPSST